MVRNFFSSEVFRPASLTTTLEAPLLVPGTILYPADVLVYSAAPAPGCAPSLSAACDATIDSPYTAQAIRHSATCVVGAARLAKRDQAACFGTHSADRAGRC